MSVPSGVRFGGIRKEALLDLIVEGGREEAGVGPSSVYG